MLALGSTVLRQLDPRVCRDGGRLKGPNCVGRQFAARGRSDLGREPTEQLGRLNTVDASHGHFGSRLSSARHKFLSKDPSPNSVCVARVVEPGTRWITATVGVGVVVGKSVTGC